MKHAHTRGGEIAISQQCMDNLYSEQDQRVIVLVAFSPLQREVITQTLQQLIMSSVLLCIYIALGI